METRYPDEFRRDAVRTATAIGLTRPQAASDFAVGLSTLNMWVQKHPPDESVPTRRHGASGPYPRTTSAKPA